MANNFIMGNPQMLEVNREVISLEVILVLLDNIKDLMVLVPLEAVLPRLIYHRIFIAIMVILVVKGTLIDHGSMEVMVSILGTLVMDMVVLMALNLTQKEEDLIGFTGMVTMVLSLILFPNVKFTTSVVTLLLTVTI